MTARVAIFCPARQISAVFILFCGKISSSRRHG